MPRHGAVVGLGRAERQLGPLDSRPAPARVGRQRAAPPGPPAAPEDQLDLELLPQRPTALDVERPVYGLVAHPHPPVAREVAPEARRHLLRRPAHREPAHDLGPEAGAALQLARPRPRRPLAGGPLDTGLSLEKLLPIAKHYQKLREKYKDIIMGVSGVNVNILLYQIPGGMYSNLQSQLKEGGCLNKFNEVLEEVPRVRKEMGYPPLVTPTSQIVGTQAAMNVISGKRWKMIPNEVRQYFRGYYGKTPAPVDPEIQKIVLGDEQPITCRPGEKIPPEIEQAKKEIGVWCTQPEDVLSYILFPQVAKDFLPAKFAKENYADLGNEPQEAPEAYAI